MKRLPSGTVTFLFTDIEGSTRLLHELGERYAGVLGGSRRQIRAAFEGHGGVEVDTQGATHRLKDLPAADAHLRLLERDLVAGVDHDEAGARKWRDDGGSPR